jgi:hypothetical protein
MKVDQALLSRAFSVDADTADAAKDELIDLNDIEVFYECINHARELRDDENLEFWLIEVATSRKSVEIIARSLIELTSEIFVPQSRFNEALIYLRYLQSSVYGDLHKEIIGLIGNLEAGLEVSHSAKSTESWQTYDLSKPLQPGLDQQHYYDRFLAYFHATNDSKVSERVEEFQSDFLPKVIGFFIGLSDSLKSYGVNRDTAVKAYIDFLKMAYPQFRPGLLKVGGSSVTLPTPPVAMKQEESNTSKQKGYGISKG